MVHSITWVLALVKMIRRKKAKKEKKQVDSLAKIIGDKYPDVAEAVKHNENNTSSVTSDTSIDQIDLNSDGNIGSDATEDRPITPVDSTSSQFKTPKSSAVKSLQFNDADELETSSQDGSVRSYEDSFMVKLIFNVVILVKF